MFNLFDPTSWYMNLNLPNTYQALAPYAFGMPQFTTPQDLFGDYLKQAEDFMQRTAVQNLGQTLANLASLGTTSSYTAQKALEGVGKEVARRSQQLGLNYLDMIYQLLGRMLLGY